MVQTVPEQLEVTRFDPALEAKTMKPTVTIGPISLDIEDTADMLTMLVTKIVESFMARRIISATQASAVMGVLSTDLTNQSKQ